MVLGKEDLFEMLKKGRPELANVEPPQMALTLEDGVLTIGLDDRALGIAGKDNWNMQKDGAAFEAWALTLKTWLGDKTKKVVLTRSGIGPMPEVKLVNNRGKWTSGHYMRFLYRIMKFSDTCKDWFTIGDSEMADRVKDFRAFYDRGSLICNEPKEEAADKRNAGNESRMEGFFERNPGLLGEDKLYRQLPVGGHRLSRQSSPRYRAKWPWSPGCFDQDRPHTFPPYAHAPFSFIIRHEELKLYK